MVPPLFNGTKVKSRVKHLHPDHSGPFWPTVVISFCYFCLSTVFTVCVLINVCVYERERERKKEKISLCPEAAQDLTYFALSCQVSTSDFVNTLPLITLVKDIHMDLPLELEPTYCSCTQHNPKHLCHSSDTCPKTDSLMAIWRGCTVLRWLQQTAVTPLNITGSLTSNVQRKMSTLPRVYITRQIPPEGLKILRESGE